MMVAKLHQADLSVSFLISYRRTRICINGVASILVNTTACCYKNL